MAAKRKRVSLRKAVDAFCKSCIYDKGAEGSWLRQVTECVSTSCPLFEARPTCKLDDKGEK